MALYESVFIARQDISAAQAEALGETFAGILRNNGGQVVKTELWGLKTLAYRIKKNRKGHYVMLGLDAPPSAVTEMERNMRINEDVLRYLTVRVEKLDATLSVMMQARSERGERGDRGDRGRRFDGDRPDRAPRPPRRAEAEGEPA
jgi:small subunit ribosomal protein S6